MVKYSCEKCGKEFTQKGHYTVHINKINPCVIESKIEEIIEKAVSKKIDEITKKNNNNNNLSILTQHNQLNSIDYSIKTHEELIEICKENNIVENNIIGNNIIENNIIENNIIGNSKKKKNANIKIVSSETSLKNKIEIIPSKEIKLNKLKMIDLFAGTGAFTLAFEETNAVNIVFGNDMVEHSKKIYDENFNHELTLKNLNEVKVEDIPKHDILTGGFPCQPFSIAGYQEGFKDERSNVFWKILSIIDYHQPKCVILENVKNLLSHDENKTFDTIKSNLEKRGYHICYKVLNTADITGIPHHRERIYIICLKSKKIFDKFNLDFPKIKKKQISDFLETDIPSKYYYTDRSSTWDLIKNNIVKKNTIYQYRRVYVRENKSNECPTLTANMGSGGHNVPIILDDKGIRKLTPRECFNFQGFPSSYKLPTLCDSNLYKLVGNAVSVPIVKLIANRIIPLLQEE